MIRVILEGVIEAAKAYNSFHGQRDLIAETHYYKDALIAERNAVTQSRQNEILHERIDDLTVQVTELAKTFKMFMDQLVIEAENDESSGSGPEQTL